MHVALIAPGCIGQVREQALPNISGAKPVAVTERLR
jgi:hypothetical protein